MQKVTTERLTRPESIELDPEVIAFRKQFEAVSSLDEMVRLGAQQMLQSAIEAEVEGFVFQHANRSMIRDGEWSFATVICLPGIFKPVLGRWS